MTSLNMQAMSLKVQGIKSVISRAILFQVSATGAHVSRQVAPRSAFPRTLCKWRGAAIQYLFGYIKKLVTELLRRKSTREDLYLTY